MQAATRNTRQRQAIRDALEAAGRPLSPLEVLEAAREAVPGIGLATVYRNLKVLADEQWIAQVDLPGDSPRYEVAGKDHHHHFRCRGCGGVFEVEGCPGDLRTMVPKGFRLEGHEVILFGRCAACMD